MKVGVLAFAVVGTAMVVSAHAQQAADDHLGTVHFPISCSAVQGKFDRAVASIVPLWKSGWLPSYAQKLVTG